MTIVLAAAPGWLPLVFGLVAVLAMAFSCWRGWINLEQGKVLQRVIQPSELGRHGGQLVTVRGKPRSLYRGGDPMFENWLWYKKRYQEYRRRYNSSSSNSSSGSWHTVRTDVANYDIELQLEGGTVVQVRNDPSEVHGSKSHTEGGGFGSDYRVLVEFLPRHATLLTVCGRLNPSGSGFSMVKDQKLGLLYSTLPPEAQAKREIMKGWLMLTLLPALIAGGSWWLYGYMAQTM